MHKKTVSSSEHIGHDGKAIKSEKTIDIPGQLICSDGTSGLKVVLTEVYFKEGLNINLLSLNCLLKQGWFIKRGIKTGIDVSNDAQDSIDFHIVIPMPKGLIFSCKFVCQQNLQWLVQLSVQK